MVFRPQKTEDRGMGFWSRSSTVPNFPSVLPLWTKIWKRGSSDFTNSSSSLHPYFNHPLLILDPLQDTEVHHSVSQCLCPSASVSLHCWSVLPHVCVSCPCLCLPHTQNSFLREQRCQLYFTRWPLLVNNNKKCAKGAVGGRDLVSRNRKLGVSGLVCCSSSLILPISLSPHHVVLPPGTHPSHHTQASRRNVLISPFTKRNYWLMVKAGIRQTQIWIPDPPLIHCMPCTSLFNLSEPVNSLVKWGNDSSYFKKLLKGLTKIMHSKCLE